MTRQELKITGLLALIIAIRMLGLFMILPVFTPYAHALQGATHLRIGITLGIYGLSQAVLQIPFGMLSDRFGRKPIIIFGLLLFILGSAIAANGQHILTVMLGRTLQGAGAIGSVLIALVADSTGEQNRSKAMAIIGVTIGFAFTLSLVIGPILHAWINIDGMFWLTAVLGCGCLVAMVLIPTPTAARFDPNLAPAPELLKQVITNFELLRLNFGIFTLHALLTASFISIPMILQHDIGLAESAQWQLYLPTLIGAFFAMLPFMLYAEKQRCVKIIFLAAIVVLGLAELAMALLPSNTLTLGLALFAFFTAFTLLEANLPAWVSKIAPAGSKGTAIGVYSSTQFLGVFAGGSIGGLLYSMHNEHTVFLYAACTCACWFIVAWFMTEPPRYATRQFSYQQQDVDLKQLQQQLWQIAGVIGINISSAEQQIYLKVDKDKLDEQALAKICST